MFASIFFLGREGMGLNSKYQIQPWYERRRMGQWTRGGSAESDSREFSTAPTGNGDLHFPCPAGQTKD